MDGSSYRFHATSLEIMHHPHGNPFVVALGERVLVDGDGVDSPRLPSIVRLQLPLGICQAQSLVVVRVRGLHRDGGIDVLVLRDGAAGFGLALDGSAPA